MDLWLRTGKSDDYCGVIVSRSCVFKTLFGHTETKGSVLWLISVLDGRLKAVVSILSRVVRTEEKSSNDVQFMLYYMTKLPLTIYVDFSMVFNQFHSSIIHRQ